jgi:photosystem II stability/assembly factor-like uncharacterized protein
MRSALLVSAALTVGLICSFFPVHHSHAAPPVVSFAGSGQETIQAMTADASGNIYVAGTTSSPDFPVQNAAQAQIGDWRLMRSGDGGATWARLPNIPADPQRIVADPVNPQVLFAGAATAIYKSTDQGLSWRQVYKWDTPFPIGPLLAIDPASPAHVTAMVPNGLIMSADGGETWSPGFRQGYGCELSADPAGSGALLFNCINHTFISRDRGLTFTDVGPPLAPADRFAAFDPYHRGWIYVVSKADASVYRSADAGQTWTKRTPLPNFAVSAVAPDPDQPDTWYVFMPDGYYVTADGAATWTHVATPAGLSFLPTPALLSRKCGSGGGIFAQAKNGILGSHDFGATWSTALPQISTVTTGPGCSLYAFRRIASDAFVGKLAPGGRQVLWSTFLGGSDRDAASAMTLDASGNIWVTGSTSSADFPAALPRVGQTGMSSAFVAKFDPFGNLLFSLILGSEGTDTPAAIAADALGNAYVAGSTFSLNFPITAGALDEQTSPAYAYDQGFVAKIGPEGQLLYAARMGQSNSAVQPRGIAVDADGQAIVAGRGSLATLPAPNNGYGGFLARLDPDGARFNYGAYFLDPSSSNNGPYALATDAQGNIYSLGLTGSNSVATSGAYSSPIRSHSCPTGTYIFCFVMQTNPPGDIVVSKLGVGDLQPVYSAILGGNCLSTPGAIAVRDDGVVTFSMRTDAGFPLLHAPYTTPTGGAIAQLSPDGSTLLFSTFVPSGGAPPIAVPGKHRVFAAINGNPHTEVTAVHPVRPQPGR